MKARLSLSCFSAVALMLATRAAYADKVALLPFGSSNTDVAQKATREALSQLGHQIASQSELDAARVRIQDGVADSSAEYLVVAHEAQADWTLAGQVVPRAEGFRVELIACEAKTGRVESLAREVAGTNQSAQVAELLTYLLRKEGLGSTAIVWNVAPVLAAAATKPSKSTETPANTVTVKPEVPETPAVKHAYAENHPLAPGIGLGFYGALARPSNAVGSSLTMNLETTFGYALSETLKGLELRGNLGFSVVGPSSMHLDAGARYAIPVVPSARIFAGPEVSLGVFAPFGGDKSVRFLARGAGFVAFGLGEQVQLDVLAEVQAAPGGSAAIVLGGGEVRATVRF